METTVDQQSLTASMAGGDLASTSSRFLLGAGSSTSKKTQLYQVYASHISQMIQHQNPSETRPVVLSLALSIQEPDWDGQQEQQQQGREQKEKEERLRDRDLFENVIELVNECCVWM